ncbi:MAG: hypothetical protein LLG14_05685 [Nocardiaceae bacterium]|nr:hypothetical protein [Nocardiaceae bacterium]
METSEQSTEPAPTVPTKTNYISYEQFGRAFVEYAVTADKVRDSVGDLSGRSFQFGPLPVGPGGLAKVDADVTLGDVAVHRKLGREMQFDVAIPIKVLLKINLTLDSSKFDVDGDIHIRLRVRAASPLRILIEIEKPRTRDVQIVVQHEGTRAALLRIFAAVDHQIKKFIVKYITDEVNKPEIQRNLEIDLTHHVDGAWGAISGSPSLQLNDDESQDDPDSPEVVAGLS